MRRGDSHAGGSDSETDDDEESTPMGVLRTPRAQTPTLIQWSELKRAQAQYEPTRKLIELLEQREAGEEVEESLTRNYELYEGLLCRTTKAEEESYDSLRPYLPPELHNTIIANYHCSIWGAHRGGQATFREVASRYFWPGMYEEIKDYVSKCDVCQLAKGGQPTRHGLLHGRHYSHAFTQICMDLVGPIHQESGSSEKYLLVILDPFTHFVWIELVDTKHAETIQEAFVRRILCEEGAPRAVLTDNGSEFKNEKLRELMAALETDHQFAPAYHPQSNQAERANRFVVETLRALVRSPGAAARDWPKYVKYVEFAMRRQPIPGTNLTPFMAMRGRDPILPIDLPLASRAPLYTASLPKHVQDIQRMKHTAEKLIKSASETVMAKNKDLHDLGRLHIQFQLGDLVRHWGVQRSSGGDAAKLKLRNGVYKVVGKREDLYDLQHVSYPEIRKSNVHVSFLARWRGEGPPPPAVEPVTPASAAAGANQRGATAPDDDVDDDDDHADDDPVGAENFSTEPITEQSKLWDQLKLNELACFVLRDESPANLRTAEVVSLAADKRTGDFWYWIDSEPGPLQLTKPIGRRRLTPEWYDGRGFTRIKPRPGDRHKLHPRQFTYGVDDIEIILPRLKTQTGGGVVPQHVEKINGWLKARARTDRRAEAALRAFTRAKDKQQGAVALELHQLLREEFSTSPTQNQSQNPVKVPAKVTCQSGSMPESHNVMRRALAGTFHAKGVKCSQTLSHVGGPRRTEHQPKARASPRTCSTHQTSDGTKRPADGDSSTPPLPASEDAFHAGSEMLKKSPGGSQMLSMQHPKSSFPCKRAETAEQSGTAKVGSVGVGTDGTFDAGCVRSLRIATLLSRWRP